MSPGRRRFWLGSIFAVISLRLAPLIQCADAAAPAGDPLRAWLDALADAIVPPDQYPGAAQAGVSAYMHSVLERNRKLRLRYRNGWTALDGAARAKGAPSFVAMPNEERSRLLLELVAENGKPDHPAAQFAESARVDVLTLYYASPTGQKMVGYQPPMGGYPQPAPEETG